MTNFVKLEGVDAHGDAMLMLARNEPAPARLTSRLSTAANVTS
jgi:hypothetical protein